MLDFDGCNNGVRGRGFVRSSLFPHIKGKHFVHGAEHDRCRDRISQNGAVFALWEDALLQLKMWLCTKCMHIQAWSKPCKSHDGDAISALNGREASFLIHGISKPLDKVSHCVDEDITDGGHSMQCCDVDLLNKVFQAQFHTIRHIPIKCKLSFSRTFKQTMDKVILNPLDISCWIKLLLFPICVMRNYIPKCKDEERSGMRKRLQIASISQALAKWHEADGCSSLILDLLAEHVNSTKHRIFTPKDNLVDINLKLCKRKLSQGSYTAAIRVLTSNGVSPFSDETLEDLQFKHPFAPPPTLPDASNEVVAANVSTDIVLSRIRSFPKGTSCGRDSLHAQHFFDVLSGPAAAVADDVLASITTSVNLLLAGNCSPQLGMFFASALLTPLLKPGGGIRPIVVGTIWRRLVSKVVIFTISKEMTSYLKDFQFSVGVPCGGEAILHSVNRILYEKHDLNFTFMLLVDFKNAFNLVDRSAMLCVVLLKCPSLYGWVQFFYASPAKLYYGTSTLSSAQGVQQGDPLGPLLFALNLHPIVLKISEQCKLDLQAWYLDDGTIIGDTMMVSKAFHIIKSEGVAVGLDLNIQKTELFWPSFGKRSTQVGVFPADIGRPSVGVKLLGGPVCLNFTLVCVLLPLVMCKMLRLFLIR
ncbi:uncharacterized protein LOC113349999 isoform X2 [Papaver somniferum]|uniref:uncharacterized protein LOC113349999 isoform X2 n=1 Tax=Papaver somniferum TaxID=3469 RepID=UPI000E6F6AC9|nr:uncharacterized protein LOC113349999 isoform X2 [Papaver somniferum]